MVWRVCILFATAWLLTATEVSAKDRLKTHLLERMWAYAQQADTLNNLPAKSYNYHKLTLHTDKRNVLMASLPTMYDLARAKKRHFVGEFFDCLTYDGEMSMTTQRLLSLTTIPHSNRTMRTLRQFTTPTPYAQTIIDDHLISPLNRHNRSFYKYKIELFDNGTADITFTPTHSNTQLVYGTARIDTLTGRLIEASFKGEYDQIRFTLFVNMNKQGAKSLFPDYCYANCRFAFMGNVLRAEIKSFFDIGIEVSEDSIAAHPLESMKAIRPQPLTAFEQELFDSHFALTDRQSESAIASAVVGNDTVTSGDNRLLETTLDLVSENMLNIIRTDFHGKRGYVQLSPIFNPLYLRYSHSKGIIYKFDVKSIYLLGSNSDLTARIKASYSFKQKRLYMEVPLRYDFDRDRNGFVGIDFRCGDKLYDSNLLKDIVREQGDTVNWKRQQLDYFRNTQLHLHAGIDITPEWRIDGGLHIQHRRSHHTAALIHYEIDNTFRSVAPMFSLTYKPIWLEGLNITTEYERSIKGLLQSNMGFERWELDANYVHSLTRLRRYFIRMGSGLYTKRGSGRYFISFTNFHENNIPLGWEDDWTGEFELLRSEWYNSSQFYLRGNFTYESPLLLASRLPLLGRLVEMERIYASALSVKAYTPYIELGYGISTRYLSVGTFMACKKGKYEGFGCKFELELFRNW